MNNEIQAQIAKIAEELKDENNSFTSPIPFSFACADLVDDFNETDRFKEFMKIIENPYPTIYWFEIKHIKDIESLIDGIDKCRKTKDFSVPPTNKNNLDSNILYVGKVQKNFNTRIKQHLGYGHKNTWSLQLRHWARDLGLNLTLNYVQFSKGASEDTSKGTSADITKIKLAIYEHCTARKLKPILGKHSF